MDDYYVESVKGGKDKDRTKFPNPQFGSHSEPLTVVDVKGRIVLWYLPGLVAIHEEASLSHSSDYGIIQ
jgi:hypothetical protein